MAKLERILTGDLYSTLHHLTSGILDASTSATLEDASDFHDGTARCAVRVFERYSWVGGNRVSLSLTLFQAAPDQPIHLSAITSGGSQAIFTKINTLGESAFLDTLTQLL
ncbi:MAG: hypothetical protein IJD21_00145 [Oscillospiraceae bacterium]|nr:hypothetical protein [Oscillospiraceae bacterium]